MTSQSAAKRAARELQQARPELAYAQARDIVEQRRARADRLEDGLAQRKPWAVAGYGAWYWSRGDQELNGKLSDILVRHGHIVDIDDADQVGAALNLVADRPNTTGYDELAAWVRLAAEKRGDHGGFALSRELPEVTARIMAAVTGDDFYCDLAKYEGSLSALIDDAEDAIAAAPETDRIGADGKEQLWVAEYRAALTALSRAAQVHTIPAEDWISNTDLEGLGYTEFGMETIFGDPARVERGADGSISKYWARNHVVAKDAATSRSTAPSLLRLAAHGA
ncbi:hypothetical protein GS504_01545 [Rhodococcus hoagii]|nr:hypothetical protein [Prescottella equi]NKS71643.1 hypothetical protein [Prescottella equi]